MGEAESDEPNGDLFETQRHAVLPHNGGQRAAGLEAIDARVEDRYRDIASLAAFVAICAEA